MAAFCEVVAAGVGMIETSKREILCLNFEPTMM
jgi:hypothetical protein